MTDEVEIDLVDMLSSLKRSEYKWKALTTIALIIGGVGLLLLRYIHHNGKYYLW